ncbi:MAG: hypothetical protein HQL49_11755 [Gammaproteobacteria bacterium]|nr:hypothetical protein [Gammaproteobacteria bacterium]
MVAISDHGYGHLAQVAPLLTALGRRLALRLTVQSGLPLAVLQQHIRLPFDHLARSADIGMVMDSAVTVRVAESLAAYRQLHLQWPQRLRDECQLLREIAPDWVLADIPYLTLAAAAEVGIPAVAICSLNWADIFAAYCGDYDEAAAYLETMRKAYRSAALFLVPEPGMAMADLPNRYPIPPLARRGRQLRRELANALQLPDNERWVLVALGGIATRLPVEQWPTINGVRWIVPADWQLATAHITPFDQLLQALPLADLTFADLLASVDAIISKSGYGTFAEAAAHATPLLNLKREDWPEAPVLEAWIAQKANVVTISATQLVQGDLAEALQQLWAQPRRAAVSANGAEVAAELICRLFGGEKVGSVRPICSGADA